MLVHEGFSVNAQASNPLTSGRDGVFLGAAVAGELLDDETGLRLETPSTEGEATDPDEIEDVKVRTTAPQAHH